MNIIVLDFLEISRHFCDVLPDPAGSEFISENLFRKHCYVSKKERRYFKKDA
jgi:hypothetical protein